MSAPDDRKSDPASGETSPSDRSTFCISSDTPGLTLHNGDAGFSDMVEQHYQKPEATANEKLCQLKARLRGLPTDQFWTTLMEGITAITGSQYALAVRRLLSDEEDHDRPVEMPEVGEPGQCLVATAFFYNDGNLHRSHIRDYKYYPYTGPCSHMRHDKVFVVPADLAHFIGDDQISRFAFPVDSYIGIPLFALDGKCLGHFGGLWSEEGMKSRNLSWGFVEMVLHSLEDIVVQKLLEGEAFSQRSESSTHSVIPSSVVSAAQSLKPYARSLSHEFRTPMQGVVGMLDIMYATVSEALEMPMKSSLAKTFSILKDDIEVIQGSSHRAIEAADNVVHAADLDMHVPETPDPFHDRHVPTEQAIDYLSARTEAPIAPPYDRKRKREDEVSTPAKYLAFEDFHVPTRPLTPRTAAVRSAVRESSQITGVDRLSTAATPVRSELDLMHTHALTPTTKVMKVREHIRTIVNECLRFGERPESAIAQETEVGELIEVRSRDSKGQMSNKSVEWLVDPSVPEEIHVDERDFAKLVSVILLNALKFTNRGRVRLSVNLSSSARSLVVNIVDTGTGIPAEFIPYLFKAFSRQDDTITRQSEGLGLGLLVAKGVARKLGGDLRCIRSAVEGADQGSEFEFRVPLTPSENNTGHNTPARTPTPSRFEDGHFETAMGRTSSSASRRDENGPGVLSPERTKPPTSNGIQFPTPKTPVQPAVLESTSPKSKAGENGEIPGQQDMRRRTSVVRPPAPGFDRQLAQKHPLRFLVAEDNRLNRKLLVTMLGKLGYTAVHEAFDGAEAVRLMETSYSGQHSGGVDVILMDLWMPNMDGYEATRRILNMQKSAGAKNHDEATDTLKILAVTADVTDDALERAKEAGMKGFMTKPYKMVDLEKLIIENCVNAA